MTRFTIKDLHEMLATAKRELTLRRSVYPGYITRGRLTTRQAEKEIANMQAIIDLLNEQLEGKGEGTQASMFPPDPER